MKVTRGSMIWATPLLASWLVLSGCGQGPAASASVQPAKPGSASASGSSDWETVVAAGKREGKVAVIGPPGDVVRNVLVDPFQKQYGMTVDYTALPGNAATARINLERNAGQYLWDILIAGSAGSLESLIPNKALDPIDSALILPEVKDPKNWRGGALPVIGPNHEILIMTPYQRGTLFYNKNLLKGDEIKSYKDLLDPKWKDKLQMDDPRRPGPGQATFIFFYLHPDLGADFIRALGKQNITIQNDYQQEIDIVGQGRAPLMIGAVDYLAEARMKQGAPIGIVEPSKIKEGTDISAASGNVSVFNKAPHPNATKVYVNWLLTKEEQEAYARANVFTDARVDVNGDWTEPWRVPVPNGIRTDGEAAVAVREKLLPVLAEAFPS
ncbi:MAG TPA: extracellular solute-binding protein [Chloroflexota bacterium]|nr:extracellular solute-binding protein [Chloroflexota bacterium]